MDSDLARAFKESAAKHSGRTAVQYREDGKWIDLSYEGLKDRVEAFSTFLSEKGVRKGDRVAIILENGPAWPAIFFATLAVGAIAVPISPDAGAKEIENILADSENILADSGCKLVFDKNSDLDAPGRHRPPAEWTPPPVALSDTACILYTSGTTDRPKGVELSHGNLVSNCGALREVNLIVPEDRIISVLPLHHAYSMTVTMLQPLLYGMTVIYPGSVKGEDISRAMKDLNPTVFVAVPQIFYSFHKKIIEALNRIPFPLNLLLNALSAFLYGVRKKTRVNLARALFFGLHGKFGKSMRLFVSGGAKLDENVQRALFKLGFTILEGYGLTETSPVLTINPLKNPKIGSVGLPVPGVELKIINKDKKGAGEVIARGPNIMKGYYKRDDLSRDVIKEGWFHTGDLGYTDKDGYLFLTGRSKDVIVLSSGLNIYPEEVEEAYLKEVPARGMCIFEVPAKKGMKESRVLWAVVVPDLEFFKKYGEVNLRNVLKERFDNVSKSLAPAKRVMGFSVTLEPLPRTLLGKIKRFEVKNIYTPRIIKEEYEPEAKELSPEDLKLIESPSGRAITDYLKKQTGVKGAIAPDDSLELDLGIDSLGRIELASGLEKLFNIKIPGDVFGRSFTVRDLILGISPLSASIPGLDKSGLPRPASIPGLDKRGCPRQSGDGINSTYWRTTLSVPPNKQNLQRIDLKPGLWPWFCCFAFTCLLKLFFKAFCNLKVEGARNIPEKGPYILYVNHTSYFDGLLVAAALTKFPRLDLFFVGFRPYFEVPVIRNLVKIGRIIPLDFSAHLLEALRSSYYVLKKGKNLCLFPEGLRTLDGKVREFKSGFGILAKESGARLVPVFLKGAFEAWPRTSKFPRRHPVTVKFGKPLDPLKTDSYAAICARSRQHLINLGS
jgi:long-chain acyl-CoA synthetase